MVRTIANNNYYSLKTYLLRFSSLFPYHSDHPDPTAIENDNLLYGANINNPTQREFNRSLERSRLARQTIPHLFTNPPTQDQDNCSEMSLDLEQAI